MSPWVLNVECRELNISAAPGVDLERRTFDIQQSTSNAKLC